MNIVLSVACIIITNYYRLPIMYLHILFYYIIFANVVHLARVALYYNNVVRTIINIIIVYNMCINGSLFIHIIFFSSTAQPNNTIRIMYIVWQKAGSEQF